MNKKKLTVYSILSLLILLSFLIYKSKKAEHKREEIKDWVMSLDGYYESESAEWLNNFPDFFRPLFEAVLNTRKIGINFTSCPVDSLEHLRDFNELNWLIIDSQKIEDYSPLSNLTNLEELNINIHQNSEIHFLEKISQLKILELHGYKITNINDLRNLKKLENLDLQECNIKDLSPIKDLKNLKSLNLTGNPVKDLKPLAKLINLEQLLLSETKVENISDISNLKNLKWLTLSNNEIKDPEVLGNFKKLVNFMCTNSNIRDISFLNGLNNLEYLNLSKNKIVNIRPLGNLTKLNTLDFHDNKGLDDISVLFDLKNLNRVDLYGTSVNKNQIKKFMEAVPWVKVSFPSN